jgi:glycogen synthase
MCGGWIRAAAASEMRIAVVTPEYPPTTIGGGGVAVQAISESFAATHTVRVFSADHGQASWCGSPRYESLHELTICRYPTCPVFTSRSFLRSVLPPNPCCIASLLRELWIWAPDVAHVHGCGYAISDLAAWALRRLKVPYLLTDHGMPQTPALRGPGLRYAYRVYEHLVMGATVRGASEVSAVSTAEAELLRSRTGRTAVVIPNGVNAAKELTAHRLERLAKWIPDLIAAIRPDVPLILAAGRLTASKGFDILIDAIGELKEEALCVIVGDSTDQRYSQSLMERAGPCVVFVDHLDHDELITLMRLATAVAVPSRHEPFGLVALEAISAGARVVASSVGGLRDFVKEPYGLLVSPTDVQGLRDALTMAMKRGRLSIAEQEIANVTLATHNWPLIAERYESVLEAIA